MLSNLEGWLVRQSEIRLLLIHGLTALCVFIFYKFILLQLGTERGGEFFSDWALTNILCAMLLLGMQKGSIALGYASKQSFPGEYLVWLLIVFSGAAITLTLFFGYTLSLVLFALGNSICVIFGSILQYQRFFLRSTIFHTSGVLVIAMVLAFFFDIRSNESLFFTLLVATLILITSYVINSEKSITVQKVSSFQAFYLKISPFFFQSFILSLLGPGLVLAVGFVGSLEQTAAVAVSLRLTALISFPQEALNRKAYIDFVSGRSQVGLLRKFFIRGWSISLLAGLSVTLGLLSFPEVWLGLFDTSLHRFTDLLFLNAIIHIANIAVGQTAIMLNACGFQAIVSKNLLISLVLVGVGVSIGLYNQDVYIVLMSYACGSLYRNLANGYHVFMYLRTRDE